MKTAHQIAKECGLSWQQVIDVIKREEIIPSETKGKFCYYNEYQEGYIRDILRLSYTVNPVVIIPKKEGKRLKQLGKELNVSPVVLQRTVLKLGLKVERINNVRMIILNEDQETEVIKTLFFERKLKEITLPSKMNIKESFEEFKQKTYGKR